MSYQQSSATPGWYPDPAGGAFERWWDGAQWTAGTRARNAAPTTYTPPPASVGVVALVPRPQTPAYGVTPPLGYGLAAPAPIGVWRSPADSRPYVRGMGDAIKVVLVKYASFDGRASRSEYWYWTLFNAIIAVACLVGLLIPVLGIVVYLALIAWSLGVLVPNIAVLVRRLRDAGFAWPWIFLSFAPGGSIALIVMAALPSKYP